MTTNDAMRTLAFRPARPADAARMQAIRLAAFAPVFASFRELLGEELYELAQRRDELAQGALLASMFLPENGWELYVAEAGGEVVGFVSLQCDRETLIGEVGLNAVDPESSGQGIGCAMYEYAAARLKQLGMRVATVSTGGDESHAPARRAYQKAGFAAGVPSVWLCRKL